MIKKEVKVFNTASGKKEEFLPLEADKVGMYVCGPTTYNYIHLGNARPLVVFDTVRRYLEYLGYEVTYIQNFTDVDDKIIKKANEEGIKPATLAARYIEEYFHDADALQVKRATVHPRVSEHIEEIIDFIKGLVEKGYAYEMSGDVLFGVTRFSEYGKLSKRSLDDLQAGARVEVDENKEHPADFVLWKKAKPNEPQWPSPWGMGRPGWHIECSAMSHKYLGPGFDIHAGGYDLVFPHHENEIAQSEALQGVPMAKYWLHNGFITVNEEKMSKSLGNFFLVRDILKKFPADVVRFYLLATHYRSPLDFDDEKLTVAQKGLDRLQTAYRLMDEVLKDTKAAQNPQAGQSGKQGFIQELQEMQGKFIEAMNDDFNTALAIAVLFDIARAINGFVAAGVAGQDRGALLEGARVYTELAGVLGLQLENKDTDPKNNFLVDALMELVIAIRQNARAKKDFQTADEIREKLKQTGIILEDTPQGVRWKHI